MPGSTPSRCSRNCSASIIPMSERQQMKLVRQLEINDSQGGNSGCLKETGPQRTRSRSCNGRGETPLHKAAIKGDEDLVNKLLEEGADPNIPDFAGWTPLHEACNHGWYRVALALIEAGASVNARGLDDDTPLHDAAINGHSKLVRLLIERGADLNSRNKGGKTPRDVAAPALMPHLLRFRFAATEKKEVEQGFDLSAAHAHENDYTAISETLETTPQPQADKSPKVTLKVHQVKKKSTGKNIFEETIYSSSKFQISKTMDEKSNKEDVYEFKSSKEATPVRGTSASPEVDKNSSEPKSEKSGDGYSGMETESSTIKRSITEVAETDDAEDEIKRKKRKEGDGKVREEAGTSSKTSNPAGRATVARNVNSGAEKGGKVTGHNLCKSSGAASKSVLSNTGVNANSDRKSPGSPKGSAPPAQHVNPNASTNNAAKTEEPQEDKSVVDGEKVDPGPKVPPLKIVIPQQTANEPEQGNRNGKNGISRHHQALPYVVSSNSNDGEKEGLRSRSASPTDSFKADEKKDPAIGMLSAEDQKGSLHHQRVLRSAHRSGPSNNGEGRAVDASASRTGNSSSQSSNSGANVTLVSNNSNTNSSSSISSNDNPSPQSQSRCSPLPQVDSNLSTSTTSLPPAGDSATGSQNSSNFRASSSTPSKTNGSSSNTTSASCYDDKTSESNSESSQIPSQTAASNPAPVELHPRKRKLKHNKEVKEPPLPQVTTERCESATTSTEVHPHDQPVKNCYQLFLDIRKQIERRRKGLFPVQPKPPQGFKDYLMNRCTYVLAGNASTRQIPTSPLPQNLSPPMKDLFSDQEKERHRLRLQHVIEKEKLVLSVEQEILRVHGRAARALANQSLPFSACTILKDEEVYNLITPEQEEKDRNARSRYNGRLFLSWLQDVDDKWEKIKEAMLLRHHNEAESLHAVQKMDWEWKMKELGSCEFKSKPVILENHVPMVHVSDDFDLLPA